MASIMPPQVLFNGARISTGTLDWGLTIFKKQMFCLIIIIFCCPYQIKYQTPPNLCTHLLKQMTNVRPVKAQLFATLNNAQTHIIFSMVFKIGSSVYFSNHFSEIENWKKNLRHSSNLGLCTPISWPI